MAGQWAEERARQEAGARAVAALPAPADAAPAAPAAGAWPHHTAQPLGACWPCKARPAQASGAVPVGYSWLPAGCLHIVNSSKCNTTRTPLTRYKLKPRHTPLLSSSSAKVWALIRSHTVAHLRDHLPNCSANAGSSCRHEAAQQPKQQPRQWGEELRAAAQLHGPGTGCPGDFEGLAAPRSPAHSGAS